MRLCSVCNCYRVDADFVKYNVPNKDVCKPCRAKKHRTKYNHSESGKANSRQAYENNRELRLSRQKAWKAANPEKVAAYRKASYAKNKQAWLVAAREREHAKLKRTPCWDLELTKLVYAEAVDLRLQRNLATGFVWEIDHIIPLRGRLVSGLHVWNNLRVIPQDQNRRKYNTYDVS